MSDKDTNQTMPSQRKSLQWSKIITVLLIALVLTFITLLATHHLPLPGHANSAATKGSQKLDPHRVLNWYDPMHPSYTADKPGIAPDCGMELVPKYADEATENKTVAGTVTLSDDKQAMAGVRTSVVTRQSVQRMVHTSAVIVPDESRIAHVHVKFNGVVEQVFANTTGTYVHKGQPLFTVYSADLLAAEEEYLLAKRSQATLSRSSVQQIASSAQSLLEAARERLSRWDISEEQIRQIDQTGRPIHALTITSPVNGYITDRKAITQSAVTTDTELYTISDLSSVWALVDIFENELPYVHVGQRVTLSFSYEQGKSYSGAIMMLYPGVDTQTRTVKARVSLSNPNTHLKPQMYAGATIHVDYGNHIAIPRDAVLDSGNQQQVFVVQDGGTFVPRAVTLGPTFDDLVVVLDGLKDGETIVTSGNFLLDSESRMKSPNTNSKQGVKP